MSARNYYLDGQDITQDMLTALGADALARLVIEKVRHDPDLYSRVASALRARRSTPADSAAPTSAIVGSSAPVQRMRDAIRKVAAREVPVLITGESGTGKELAATEIHRLSRRAGGPFVPINCAALPPSLIASELFGYEKGAFTGASHRRIGRIQAAHGGTVFLDEVADLPLELQAHLLRFLQEKTVDPLGGDKPVKVDVRVLAATNVPLREAVDKGRFREDLYYRLNIVPIELPPLRERGEDVVALCHYFLRQFAREEGRDHVPELTEQALRAVRRHSWPGNIRELAACMRRAIVMADGTTIGVDDLGLPAHDGEEPATARNGRASLDLARDEAEGETVRRVLATVNGNVTHAARELGVSRVTVYRLLDKHGVARTR